MDTTLVREAFADLALGVRFAVRPKPGARVFIIEGEIAAGKTELTKAIGAELRSRGLKVVLVFEPVHKWREVGVLRKFYDDPSRWGYGFQTYVFATRVLEIVQAVTAEPDADIYLLERSPATDMIFMYAQRSLVDPVEMQMYATWCDAFLLMLPIDLPSAKVLYLQTSLKQCMERLASRAREEEIREKQLAASGGVTIEDLPTGPVSDGTSVGGVSIEYQRHLRALHEAFLLGHGVENFPQLSKSPFPRSSVILIDPDLADLDWRKNSESEARVVAAIVDKMGI
jgi:deoxyadenosine/deoxycytidine kinase